MSQKIRRLVRREFVEKSNRGVSNSVPHNKNEAELHTGDTEGGERGASVCL